MRQPVTLGPEPPIPTWQDSWVSAQALPLGGCAEAQASPSVPRQGGPGLTSAPAGRSGTPNLLRPPAPTVLTLGIWLLHLTEKPDALQEQEPVIPGQGALFLFLFKHGRAPMILPHLLTDGQTKAQGGPACSLPEQGGGIHTTRVSCMASVLSPYPCGPRVAFSSWRQSRGLEAGQAMGKQLNLGLNWGSHMCLEPELTIESYCLLSGP